MGYGGIPTYYGPSGTASYRFFGSLVENRTARIGTYRRRKIGRSTTHATCSTC